MSQSNCFKCGKRLGIDKPMEELILERFPVFCSVSCSTKFPAPETEEFERKFKELEKEYGVKPK